jgi:hypothetical protein
MFCRYTWNYRHYKHYLTEFEICSSHSEEDVEVAFQDVTPRGLVQP